MQSGGGSEGPAKHLVSSCAIMETWGDGRENPWLAEERKKERKRGNGYAREESKSGPSLWSANNAGHGERRLRTLQYMHARRQLVTFTVGLHHTEKWQDLPTIRHSRNECLMPFPHSTFDNPKSRGEMKWSSASGRRVSTTLQTGRVGY